MKIIVFPMNNQRSIFLLLRIIMQRLWKNPIDKSIYKHPLLLAIPSYLVAMDGIC